MMRKLPVDPIDLHIGRRLREQRVACGLTQTALGERVGVSFQQVQKYEGGRDRVAASRLYHLAAALGVATSYFYAGLDSTVPRHVTNKERHVLELVKVFRAIVHPLLQVEVIRVARAVAEADAEIRRCQQAVRDQGSGIRDQGSDNQPAQAAE